MRVIIQVSCGILSVSLQGDPPLPMMTIPNQGNRMVEVSVVVLIVVGSALLKRLQEEALLIRKQFSRNVP
jgi:hypothetical protein